MFQLNTSSSHKFEISSNTFLIIFISYFYQPHLSVEIGEMHDKILNLRGEIYLTKNSENVNEINPCNISSNF